MADRLDTDSTTRIMRYDAGRKSAGVAYLLWLFLGSIGGHRCYLGSYGVGLLILACTLLSFVKLGLTGLVSLIILVWDLFTIPSQVRRLNERLIASLA